MKQSSYSYEDLISCGNGELFGPGNAQLPQPPMLMLDRITEISEDGGEYGKGAITAELDINPDLDAMWQLVGFYLGWLGGPGRGRALGAGQIKFTGQVLPTNKKVTYNINLSRVIARKLYMGIADATMEVDGKLIYEATNLKVGLFTDTSAF